MERLRSLKEETINWEQKKKSHLSIELLSTEKEIVSITIKLDRGMLQEEEL